MKTLLLIDINNILYRSLVFKTPFIFAGKNTTGLYGFLHQFFSYINTYQPTDIIGLMDYAPYKRKEIYPTYKENKTMFDKVKSNTINEGRNYLRDFFKVANIMLWEEKGFEADDLIAIICKEHIKNYDNIIIASNDADLYQLLTHDKIMLHTKSKGLYTRDKFLKEYYPFNENDYVLILSITGTHNNVTGIKGIQEKTAMKLLLNPLNPKWIKFYQDNRDIILRNKKLIKLPLESLQMPSIIKFKVDDRTIFNFLMKSYGVNIEPYMQKAIEYLSGSGL
jgi:DNA polymerase I